MIRNAHTEDAEILSEIIYKNLSQVNANDYSNKIIDNMKSYYCKDNIVKWINENPTFIVCLIEDKVVGCVKMNNLELQCLYVDPAYHGYGYGKSLVKAVEDLYNGKIIVLYASLTAYTFYKKIGYKTIRKVNDPIMGEAYKMTKSC